MTDEELERALRAALRSEDPGEQFTERLVARLQLHVPTPAHAHLAGPRRWLPLALAACLLAGIGLSYQTVQRHQRARDARAELLEALNITTGYVNTVRGAVIREERDPP